MDIEGLTLALLVFSWWCWQRETSARVTRLEAARHPPDPEALADVRRKALAWEARCKAERARLDELAGERGYDAYLAPIRAQIAAQNLPPSVGEALAWEARCKAERARLDELAGERGYDAYLAPIRAQIAAQNQR